MSIKNKLKNSRQKSSEPNPRGMLERLKEVLGVTTQVELASLLSIKPQAIISAIRRGEIPKAWLYKAAYEKQVSIEWLKTGEGRKYLSDRLARASAKYGAPIPPATRRLLTAWSDLGEDEKKILILCAEMLHDTDEDTRLLMNQVLSALDRHMSYRAQKMK